MCIASLFQVSIDYLCGIENGFENMTNDIIEQANYKQCDNFNELLELYTLLERQIKSFPLNENLLIHQLRFLRWMHDCSESDEQQHYANELIFPIAQKILDISQDDEHRSYANYNLSVYFCEQIPTEVTKNKAVEYGEKVLFKDMSLSLFCTLGKPFLSDDFAAGCLNGVDVATDSLKRVIGNLARHFRRKDEIEKYETLMEYVRTLDVDIQEIISVNT